MKEIELPSEELAEELQRYLLDKRFVGSDYDKARKTIQFPDNMSLLQWSRLRDTIEKWAKGRSMQVTESLRLQTREPEAVQAKEETKHLEAQVKKALEKPSPQEAEQRYNYLQSKPISELTDEEVEERIALAQRKPEKD